MIEKSKDLKQLKFGINMDYFILFFILFLLAIEIRYRPRLGQSNNFILLWYGNSYHRRKYIVLFKKMDN